MGIISAISAKQMKITLIILLLVHFLMNFGENNQHLMKNMNIETTIFFKHIVLGYNIYDKNLSNIRFFVKQNVVGFSIYKSYYIYE